MKNALVYLKYGKEEKSDRDLQIQGTHKTKGPQIQHPFHQNHSNWAWSARAPGLQNLRLTFLHSGHACFEIHWGDGSTNYCGDVLLAQRNAIWQPCIIEVKFQHKLARFTKHNNWWELYMTSMEMGMKTPRSKREEINIIRLPEGVCMCVIRWWEIGVNREFLSEIFKQFTGTW